MATALAVSRKNFEQIKPFIVNEDAQRFLLIAAAMDAHACIIGGHLFKKGSGCVGIIAIDLANLEVGIKMVNSRLAAYSANTAWMMLLDTPEANQTAENLLRTGTQSHGGQA